MEHFGGNQLNQGLWLILFLPMNSAGKNFGTMFARGDLIIYQLTRKSNDELFHAGMLSSPLTQGCVYKSHRLLCDACLNALAKPNHSAQAASILTSCTSSCFDVFRWEWFFDGFCFNHSSTAAHFCECYSMYIYLQVNKSCECIFLCVNLVIMFHYVSATFKIGSRVVLVQPLKQREVHRRHCPH